MGNFEEGQSKPEKKLANPKVVVALAGAIGAVSAGITGLGMKTLNDSIQVESVERAQEHVAEIFLTQLNDLYKNHMDEYDPKKVDGLFATYLQGPIQSDGSRRSIAPEEGARKLEEAVATAMRRGGLDPSTVNSLLHSYKMWKESADKSATFSDEPPRPDEPAFPADPYSDSQPFKFQEPQEPTAPNPLRPRDI